MEDGGEGGAHFIVCDGVEHEQFGVSEHAGCGVASFSVFGGFLHLVAVEIHGEGVVFEGIQVCVLFGGLDEISVRYLVRNGL